MPLDYLTVGQTAELFQVEQWQARRAVDALGVEIPRIANYRAIPRRLLGAVATELQRRGWLPTVDEVSAK